MVNILPRFARTITPAKVLFLLATAIVANAASTADLAGDIVPSLAANQDRTRIELGHIDVVGPDAVALPFSADGTMICAWWWPEHRGRGYDRQPVEFRIFNLGGKPMCGSTDTDHSLMLTNFPSIAWRETQRAFVEKGQSWLFAPDYSWGIRVFRETSYRKVPIECWMLPLPSNALPIWSRLINDANACDPVTTLGDSGAEVLFTLPRGEAIILSRRSGETVRRFTLGHIETEKEAAKRKRKFGFKGSDGDPALHFSPHAFSYDPKSRRLACGAFFDKRVRVIDIAAPEAVVFEANTEVNPWRPKGGSWRVRRVEFVSRGRYLVAGYDYTGNGPILSIDSTEIFDARTWKCIWSEEDSKIASVSLSPDGRLLAYVRDNGIEIVPFRPNR